MNTIRKSDEPILPSTSTNNGDAESSAEPSEERGSAKRNAEQAALSRTPRRTKRKSRGLGGVREAARKDSKLKFTALLHHINEDCRFCREDEGTRHLEKELRPLFAFEKLLAKDDAEVALDVLTGKLKL